MIQPRAIKTLAGALNRIESALLKCFPISG